MADRVTYAFSGLMLERFVQKALEEGITFQSVQRTGKAEAFLTTDAIGGQALMELARRYALNVREISHTGPGVLLGRALHRWTLPAALILCAALSLSFLGRLWIIEVNMLDGNEHTAIIERALMQKGIVPGTPLDGIDMKHLALDLRQMCPDFSYIGIHTQGVKLLVEATQAYPVPDVYHPGAARDLVASTDALLMTLDVTAGTAQVKPGELVRKGQVLIRGEERDERETLRGVCALGSAIGRVWLTGEAKGSLSQTVLKDTGETRSERTLSLPGLSVPLSRCEPFDRERCEIRRKTIGGLLFPLSVEETVHYRQQESTEKADEAKFKEEITQIALDRALSLLPDGILPVDKWVDYSMIDGGIFCARAVLEIRINIAADRSALNPQPTEAIAWTRSNTRLP